MPVEALSGFALLPFTRRFLSLCSPPKVAYSIEASTASSKQYPLTR